MWLITQHGFYSLVRDRENAARFLVRSRVRKDLLNLKSLAGLEAEVQSSPDREYPFRLRIDEREMPRIMNALGNSIDYPSFTSRIAQRIDQACRTLLYGEVLNTLRAIYDPAAVSQLRRPNPPSSPLPPEPHAETREPLSHATPTLAACSPKSSAKSKSLEASGGPDELPFTPEPTPPPARRARPLNIPSRLVHN